MLAQTYVNCWHSDTENVKEILERDILLKNEPKKDEKQAERDKPTKEKLIFRNKEIERTR